MTNLQECGFHQSAPRWGSHEFHRLDSQAVDCTVLLRRSSMGAAATCETHVEVEIAPLKCIFEMHLEFEISNILYIYIPISSLIWLYIINSCLKETRSMVFVGSHWKYGVHAAIFYASASPLQQKSASPRWSLWETRSTARKRGIHYFSIEKWRNHGKDGKSPAINRGFDMF